MRCNLNPKDASNPVFVAQLGDPHRYVTASDPGYYPAADGKVWTSVAQDPALTGDLARPAWVMTRENPGADLLSGVAAALSAASLVLAAEDAAWAGLALTHARYLYAFGTSQSLSPKSACASMPCTTE
ncbi:glyco_trans_2-like domain-containing protein, partial [Haematococcus lacustris]